jgi:undecaprenyl-diphosphatase
VLSLPYALAMHAAWPRFGQRVLDGLNRSYRCLLAKPIALGWVKA